jgi:hypothetical protein
MSTFDIAAIGYFLLLWGMFGLGFLLGKKSARKAERQRHQEATALLEELKGKHG